MLRMELADRTERIELTLSRLRIAFTDKMEPIPKRARIEKLEKVDPTLPKEKNDSRLVASRKARARLKNVSAAEGVDGWFNGFGSLFEVMFFNYQ